MASPGTLPKNLLNEYRSYVSQKTLLNKGGLESAQPENINTLRVSDRKSPPKRRYNKKRHVACRLKAITPNKKIKDASVVHAPRGEIKAKGKKKKKLLQIHETNGSNGKEKLSSTENAVEEDVLISLDEAFTLPESAPPPLISLDEAFAPPPKYQSYRKEHIERMKKKAAQNMSNKLRLRKPSRANSNASQVNPWTPMKTPNSHSPEDDLSTMLHISSG